MFDYILESWANKGGAWLCLTIFSNIRFYLVIYLLTNFSIKVISAASPILTLTPQYLCNKEKVN